MSERVPRLVPEELTTAQCELYAAIVSGPRAQGPQHFPLLRDDGSLRGPFNAMLLAPELGGPLQAVGSAIRFRGSLSDRERELAILAVAAHWGSAFERESHEAVGRAAGLDERELDAVRRGDHATFGERERAVLDATRALAAGDLDEAQWESARALLDLDRLYELTVLVGYYATLALQLRVFRVEA